MIQANKGGQEPYHWLLRGLSRNFCLMSNPLSSHLSPFFSSYRNKIYNWHKNVSLASNHIHSSISPHKTVLLTRLLAITNVLLFE
jgi:hypothetical protein